MELKPIGVIHSPFKEAQGTPVQPSAAGDAQGEVEVFEEYAPGLKDLEGFERIWLIFWLDRAKPVKLITPTYLDETPHGVFATRAPSRPNPLGISAVRLLGVEGNRLQVSEIDILDGTPLLDIKPYISHTDVFKVERNGWFAEAWEKRQKRERIADDRFYSPPKDPASKSS
jgi:tRNA-Thr(GGU) m(6)t(6)A37 methyltransferase TsaA